MWRIDYRMRAFLKETLKNTNKKMGRLTGSRFKEVIDDEEYDGFALDVNVTNQLDGAKNLETHTLIDDTAFTATITGDDIDFSELKHGIITARLGAISSGSPTLQVKLQLKDSTGNYIDYLNLPTVSSASTVIFDDFYFLPFATGRLIATFGGTGGFNNVTVELQGW